ncbi:MAG: hypothetical protein ABSG41_23910 [Bryobacteraceae bacterium]|jgi:DNA-binding protein HU-beta
MADGFNGIITQLERQKAAIERALVALREVDAPATEAQIEPASTPEAPIRKRRKFSAASRRKMALAQKARWAKIKGEIAPPPATPKAPKRRISAEGMKRIIAATKKRWRLQRAAAKSALASKVAPRKAAAKRAVKKAAPAPTTAPDQMQTVG